MRVPINITGGSYKSRSLPLSAQVTRNLYPEIQESQQAKSQYVLQPFPGYAAFSVFAEKDVLSTITLATTDAVSSSAANLNFLMDAKFYEGGTRLYVMFSRDGGFTATNGRIVQYTLSTAYDVSTATKVGEGAVDYRVISFEFNNNGTKIYFSSKAAATIYQATLSTAWDITSAAGLTGFTSAFNTSGNPASNSVTCMRFSPDGTKLILGLAGTLYQWNCSTPFNAATATHSGNNLTVSGEITSVMGFDFNAQGTEIYAMDSDGDIYEYSLTAAYQMVGSYSGNSFTINPDTTAPTSLTLTDSKVLSADTRSSATSNFIIEYGATYDIGYIGKPAGAERGMFEHLGVLYQVLGTVLYSINSAGERTNLGTITGSEPCVFDGIGQSIVIVSEGNMYVWDGATLTTVSDTDLENPNSVAHLNNQIIVDGDEGRFATSAVGDPTDIPALNYATAESNADDLKRVYVMGSTLYLMGDKTIEQWWNSGSGSPPWDRIEGGTIPVGLQAIYSVADNGDAMYFLGHDLRVWAVAGSSKKIISTIPLSHAIEGYATTTDAEGTYFTFEGQGFYQLTFPTADKSWCFHEQSGEWFEVSSGSAGGRSIFNHAVSCYNKTLVSDYATGSIYELDVDTFTENGDTIHRVRDTGVIHGALFGKPGAWLEMNKFELLCETGVSDLTTTPEIMLSWSDDGGRTFSSESWGTLNIGTAGQYQKKVEWFCLGGFYERIFRIRFTEAARLSIYSASAEIEIGI